MMGEGDRERIHALLSKAIILCVCVCVCVYLVRCWRLTLDYVSQPLVVSESQTHYTSGITNTPYQLVIAVAPLAVTHLLHVS